MGISTIAYLNRYRVNQAKEKLISGNQSIAFVASSVGFIDSAYFSRVFRKEVGMTPKT